jgi:nucleoside-diphosphate-sugar epimerase
MMDSNAVLILGGNGYLGSALARHLRTQGLRVVALDNGHRDGPVEPLCQRRDFRDLTAAELKEFGGLVLLAGYSSVAACDSQPCAAFAGNVSAFVDFVHKLQGQKLIFASSSSIYIDTGGKLADESASLPAPVSYYDLHKQLIEHYARIAYPNHFALRFGTVCGSSPRLRPDLLLNSLVRSALTRHQLDVANRQVHRPLLGINDLCRAITLVLTQSLEPGPYNLASVNVTIGEVADYVAARFAAPCHEKPCSTRYDMQISSDKFSHATGLRFLDTVENLVEQLAVHYANEHSHAR